MRKETIVKQFKKTRNILQVVCPNTGMEYSKVKTQWESICANPEILQPRDNKIQLDLIYGREIFKLFEVPEGDTKALLKLLNQA